MRREIERKFLVDTDSFVPAAAGSRIVQGYLSTHPDRTVRIRMEDGVATLTIKGRRRGLVAAEYEYEIPAGEAEDMLSSLAVPELVVKTRYRVPHEGLVWDVDVFDGANAGLVVAEVELEDEADVPVLPEWVTHEVTERPEYTNARLAERPFSQWRTEP